MSESGPHRDTTFVVILGASAFPNARKLEVGNTNAFLNSAKALRDYFLDSEGFALPEKNLKWLFDSETLPSEQDEAISDFLQTRTDELKTQGISPQDILVFYIGHGGVAQNEYYLALRSTKTDRETVTGYTAKLLGQTLKTSVTRHLRKYVILDSCFSAAAYKAFMATGPLEVARQKTLKVVEELPGRGTALFAASGPREPAKALPGETYTMFSGGLLEVLKRGDPNEAEKLSLKSVYDLTLERLKQLYPDEFVRPEIHAPDQTKGHIADLPFFPNAALTSDSFNKGNKGPQPRPVSVVPPQTPIEFDWVKVPAGEFLFGKDKKRIYLAEFYISRTLVTQAEYKSFLDATGLKWPIRLIYARNLEGPLISQENEEHPVLGASWDDIQAFCQWAGVFLPTEQQWEKAARGGTYLDGDDSAREENPYPARIYPWGNEEPTETLANFAKLDKFMGLEFFTTPVGRYSPLGDSPYGVVDMAGNAWEWTNSWYEEGQERVLRGGAFNSSSIGLLCTVRYGWPLDIRCYYGGIRVVYPGD